MSSLSRPEHRSKRPQKMPPKTLHLPKITQTPGRPKHSIKRPPKTFYAFIITDEICFVNGFQKKNFGFLNV